MQVGNGNRQTDNVGRGGNISYAATRNVNVAAESGGGGERFASFFFWLAINGGHYFFRYFATDGGDFNVTFLRLFLRLGKLRFWVKLLRDLFDFDFGFLCELAIRQEVVRCMLAEWRDERKCIN